MTASLPATLTFRRADQWVATGIGDRMGVWVPLFALAMLWGNATVALRWAPPWKKLNERIAGDTRSAADCLRYPDFVRRIGPDEEPGDAIVIDLQIPMAGLPKGPEGPSTRPHHQLAFDRVPAILWWRWKLKGLLPTGSTRLEQFLAACRRAAYGVQCNPDCVPPAASDLEQLLILARRRRTPRVFVHLRRGDRFMGDNQQKQRFERQTHKRLRAIVKQLAAARANTGASPPIQWVFMSDDSASAETARAVLSAAAAELFLPMDVQMVPPNATVWAFTAFRYASGVVVSCNKDGWSSFSTVPSLLLGVPLYCVSDNDNPPGGMYARHSYLPAEAIALHHRDVQIRATLTPSESLSTRKRIALCWTTNEEAGFARAVLQHADETPGESL
jgi:hypothetical protein